MCPSEKTIVLCTNVTHTLHINKTEKEALKFEHGEFPLNWRRWEHVQGQLILELVSPEKQ